MTSHNRRQLNLQQSRLETRMPLRSLDIHRNRSLSEGSTSLVITGVSDPTASGELTPLLPAGVHSCAEVWTLAWPAPILRSGCIGRTELPSSLSSVR